MGVDVSGPVRRAYTTMISAITVNGSPVKVYDGFAPDEVYAGKDEFFYCVIKDQTSDDSVKTKGRLAYISVITLQLFHGFRTGGGRATIDEVSNKIFMAVISSVGNSVDLSPYNLDIITTRLNNDTSYPIPTKSHKVWTRIIKFKHHISEK